MKRKSIFFVCSFSLSIATVNAFSQQGEKTIMRNGISYTELPFAAVQRSALWKNPKIPVCWEEMTPEFESLRASVKSAVSDTWEKNSKLSFHGWDQCQADSRGIRIRVADEGPKVESLGRYLDKRPGGMTLNFLFKNYARTRCPQDINDCVRITAIHEFGHALGFAHEHNRDDTPNECKKEKAGVLPDWKVTKYDANSVMNYCNHTWMGDGRLSTNDITALQEIYGKP